jgi:prepilin-type processing-associated H-X9-DG protein
MQFKNTAWVVVAIDTDWVTPLYRHAERDHFLFLDGHVMALDAATVAAPDPFGNTPWLAWGTTTYE